MPLLINFIWKHYCFCGLFGLSAILVHRRIARYNYAKVHLLVSPYITTFLLSDLHSLNTSFLVHAVLCTSLSLLGRFPLCCLVVWVSDEQRCASCRPQQRLQRHLEVCLALDTLYDKVNYKAVIPMIDCVTEWILKTIPHLSKYTHFHLFHLNRKILNFAWALDEYFL